MTTPSFIPRRITRALALLLGSGVLTLQAALTIQVVNDSGLPDSQVYALLIGREANGHPVSVSGIPVANGSGVNNPPVSSAPLSSLASAGFQVSSQFSGRSLPVYQFTVNSIGSAAFVPSYHHPVIYTNSNPSPITSNFRFDQFELTFDPSITSVANLTSIDAYSIPMQLELFASAQAATPLARRTYYTSTEGLIAKLTSLKCTSAFYGVKSNGAPLGPWTPTNGLAQFVRILGPGKISSGTTNGLPTPFPSFGKYLSSLVSYQFTVGGSANDSTYNYNGTVVSDGQGGYKVNLTGTTVPAPPSPIPANAAVTVNLPNGSAPGSQQTINYDSFIYGAVLSGSSFSVAGMTPAEIQSNVNIVYGAIARDVLSGLNFGYLKGRYGNNGAIWYGVPPTKFPFGLARSSNDGYYNPWAAVFYNESEAYGFAFSDRSGPSPALTLQNNQFLRVTILPDQRLDSPKVAVTATNSTSLTLVWPAVPGATSYEVDLLVPGHRAPITVAATSPSVTTVLSGLSPGTPYTFAVTAKGTANGQPVHSPAILHQNSTTGTLVPVSVPNGIKFDVSLSWAANVPAGATATVNGFTLTYDTSKMQWLNNGQNAQVTGQAGTNQYVFTIQDPAQGVIFANIIEAVFSGSPSSYTLGGSRLVGNQQPLTQGKPPYSPGNVLVLGIPFTPQPTKAFSPVLFPSATYSEWVGYYPGLSDLQPESDPDQDGSSSFLEYFRGSNPAVAETEDFVNLTVLDDHRLRFRYWKSQIAQGVSETVEWSTDLETWTSVGLVYQPDEAVGLDLIRTVELATPLAQPAFLRYTVD
ncbi:MAG: hypothetical protein J0M24_27655 [Verrucomicrobia bacterium]|nr:hypothetical protein [Verrucomicrobiota bacterium]